MRTPGSSIVLAGLATLALTAGVARAACPVAAAMAALAPGPDDVVDVFACVAGRFGGHRGWAIEAFVTAPTGTHAHVALVLDAATRAPIARDREDDIATHAFDLRDGVRLVAADLDGDGDDELVRATTGDAWGDVSHELVILAVRAGHEVELGRLAIDRDNTAGAADAADQVVCTGRWALGRRGGRAVITVRGAIARQPAGGAHGCPEPGRHRYAVRQGALVRLP